MKKHSLRALALSLALAFAAPLYPTAFAAPPADSGAAAEAAPGEPAGPADPELAAKVQAILDEEKQAQKIESPRTEAEKKTLSDMLAVGAPGADKVELIPEKVAAATRIDESGVAEFVAEGKEGIPRPAAPDEINRRPLEGEVAAAMGKKGDEQTSAVVAAGEDRPAEAGRTMDSWTANRPAEDDIAGYLKPYVGKTIVAVDIEGISDETAEVARNAVLSRPGDIFTTASIDKDRDSIYNTGLFYDLYPTMKTVPEGVVITYNVMENPRLNRLEISGNTIYSFDELRKLIKAEEGKVLNTRRLHEDVQAVDSRYHEDGYILVKIGELDINKEGVLKIAINEGVLEGYLVKGNKKTREKVITRELRQKPGEPFNAKKARRGMQRVYNLGYFEDVNMKLNPGVEPNAVVLEIDVVEKRSGTFTVGAGYSSQDGLIFMAGIGDRNLGGSGDAVNLTFEISGDDEDAHGWVFSYHKPWLDRKETGALLRLYNRTYEYDDYDTHGHEIEEYMRKYSGGEITLSRPQTEYQTNFITFRHRKDSYVKHNDYKDRSGLAFKGWRDYNFGTTEAIILDHVSDTRDNIYNPTSGSRQSISFEYAGLGGDFDFEKYTYDDQHYFKVGRSQVIAFHAAYGYGTGHISESNQYRIGGQKTLRGYRDEQFRGNHTTYGALEYRFPLVKKIEAALFTDFGAAWDTGFGPKNWKQSVGLGLGLNTPMGPIRLDYGYGSQGGRVHFSVGGSF